jgi:hypothetical protein
VTHKTGGGTRRDPSYFEEAVGAASEAFRVAGVPHVLVGGLALAAHGYSRATKDVDFMVGEAAFDHHGLLVTPRADLPIMYDDVVIDWVSLEPDERAALEGFLVLPSKGEVPVIPAAALIFMKLVAGRQRDKGDVVELVKAGIHLGEARAFLGSWRPELVNDFEDLVAKASQED